MIKYSVGIDVSKDSLHCCIAVIDQLQKVTFKSSRKFPNNNAGFNELLVWVDKHQKQKQLPVVFAMEATGVYYERLALHLFTAGCSLSVLLPNKAKKYLQATGLKSKNDKIDAKGLARMGAEQSLELWQPMGLYFYQLRDLTRQYQSLQEYKTALTNQLHALSYAMFETRLVKKQLMSQIKLFDKQIQELVIAIRKHLQENEQVSKRVNGICKIKGLGPLTVAVVLAETNGFALFDNSRQLVSYSGYDVVENQSGKYKGKTRISKKGNSRIRRALHMPAFNMITYSQAPFVSLYERTLAKHGQKMKSYVAVQKKLLVLIYSLWKSNQDYDPDHGDKHTKEKEQVSSSLPAPKEPSPENENSATKGATQGRHTSEISQSASSLQKQN